MATVVIAASARADLAEVLSWSGTQFGPVVRQAYAGLVAQVLQDLSSLPPTLRREDGIFEGCLLYHLSWSLTRARTIRGLKLSTARHFAVCELHGDELRVLAVVHDSRDVPRFVRAQLGLEAP